MINLEMLALRLLKLLDLLHESKLLVEIEVRSQKSEVRKQNFYREKFIYARGLFC